MLSAIMYGARISLLVGLSRVLFATVLGVSLGLLAGYVGGAVDALLMRIADVQLTFPAILVALLVDGVVRAVVPREVHDQIALFVVIFAIGISDWVQFARTVRGSTLVERNKEYVQAARVIGVPPLRIMVQPRAAQRRRPGAGDRRRSTSALAIITEATLSFLGVGMPPTQPSLGTLIRIGNDFLFSGEWWITIFPGLALVADGARRSTCSATGCATPSTRSSADGPAGRRARRCCSVRNLRVEFPTRRGTLVALDDVSFDIAPGEILGVVGESGAGKSMTGAAIIGLLEPPGRIAGGEILFDGKRIDNLPLRTDAPAPRQATSARSSRTR